ncbi:MAG: GNAT family N-acetyltransferase [bacterium]|nr:GNAT family N-acetyltransferase [bacterium]
MTTNWSAAGFKLPPISQQVGPFVGSSWLETWWTHRGEGELLLRETEDSLVALTLNHGKVKIAGEADLTDYHSPLGHAAVPALSNLVADLEPGTKLCLNSLPEEAAKAVAASLESVGVDPMVEEHAVTAVLHLPASFDDYLMSLGKKDRHELRRKRRRFENEVGPYRVERRSGPDAVALFAHLHRLSSGDKGTFMTAEMEDFFLALHTSAGGVIDVLTDASGQAASAIFSFEDAEGFYLYNSAYEPEMRNLSPGNVMLSHLIERAIEDDKQVFDFLKGDEAYKFRLGAIARRLLRVSATIGTAS